MSQLVNCCSTLMLVITSSCTLKHFNIRLSFILLHLQWCHPLFSLHWFYIPQWVRTDRVSGWISVQMACLCFRLLYSSVDVERPLASTWVSEIWGDGSEGIERDSINGADGQAPIPSRKWAPCGLCICEHAYACLFARVFMRLQGARGTWASPDGS